MNLKNTIVLGIMAVLGFTIVSHEMNVSMLNHQNLKVSQEMTKEAILKKYKGAKHLTQAQLKELLHTVGFKGHGLKMAWSVAMAESGGRPLAQNQSRRTGDSSYGLFQINMIGDLGPTRREQFNLKTNSELLDPVRNAQVAFYMSGHGTNWIAWKNGKTPRAKEFLTQYKNVI